MPTRFHDPRSPSVVAGWLTAVALTIPTATAQGSDAAPTGLERDTGPWKKELIDELSTEIDEKTYRDINSIVVLRRGKLLFERYYNGVTRDTVHDVRSVGKTFAATLLGLALRDGHLDSVDQRLGEFYDLRKHANYSDAKADVTLRHLLTMTSGFDGYDFEESSVGNEENMYPQPDWVRWTLDLPMATDRRPGQRWFYFTAGVVLLGDILARRVPGGLEVYAHDKLFAPLGIHDYRWVYTPQRVPSTAGGIRLRPLDFAKFGQLHKNAGTWNGKRILPAAWVSESMQPRHETTIPGERYGYLWWHKKYTVGDVDIPVTYCGGNGGNKIFVFTDRPLVIVITASAYGQAYAHTQVDDLMAEYVLPAVLD